MHKTFDFRTDTISFHHKAGPASEYQGDFHSHENFYEIFYLVNGEVIFHIENNSFHLPQGSLVLIPLNTKHCITPHCDTVLDRYTIHFSPQMLPTEYRQALLRPFYENKYGNTFYFSEVSNSRLPECFDSLSDLDTCPEDVRLLYAYIILESILIHILTFSRSSDILPPAYSPTAQRVVEYLNDHLTETLSLDCIAMALYMNKDHLNREFKKSLGVTIKEWIQYQRIMLAQKLIHQNQISDMDSITEVALATGFQSYSTFYRTYKKVLGYAPSDELKA